MKNGSVMIGTWSKDLSDGLFSIQKTEGDEKDMVIFKEGMKIELSKKQTSKDIGYYILSGILMCAFYFSIIFSLS